jgi:hypothetical protein
MFSPFSCCVGRFMWKSIYSTTTRLQTDFSWVALTLLYIIITFSVLLLLSHAYVRNNRIVIWPQKKTGRQPLMPLHHSLTLFFASETHPPDRKGHLLFNIPFRRQWAVLPLLYLPPVYNLVLFSFYCLPFHVFAFCSVFYSSSSTRS